MSSVAVVTGGGTGIGRATAEELRRAGMEVTITGRRADVLAATAARIGAAAVAFDAADPVQVGSALSQLPERIDVLVAAAGGNTDLGAADPGDGLEALRRRWLANFEANVLTTVIGVNALLPRVADHGRIAVLGSVTARSGGGSYGAVKAALEPYAGELAFELGRRGITVNVVAPGPTEGTEFFRGADIPERRRAYVASRSASGRVGTVGDVASTIAFLCSPQAGHITGQVIHVSGGLYLGR